jgi:hypothetical protein
MADLDHVYIPTYGVDHANEDGAVVPLLNPDGVGADESNDNLLVTLWGIDSPAVLPPGPGVPPWTNIIAPSYLDTTPFGAETFAFGDEARAPAVEQGMKSRVSCRYFYADKDAPKPATLLHVLNPPQEYKQQLVGAVEFNGDDPNPGTNPAWMTAFTVKKSLQGIRAWEVYSYIAEGPFLSGFGAVDTDIVVWWSNYVSLGSLAGGIPHGIQIPFLKTNGADGNPPEFFDTSTAAGMYETIAAVNKGDFYVALMVTGAAATGNAIYTTINWPHSTARG